MTDPLVRLFEMEYMRDYLSTEEGQKELVGLIQKPSVSASHPHRREEHFKPQPLCPCCKQTLPPEPKRSYNPSVTDITS